MSSETDHPRQRTVAELLAAHGDTGATSATGRRRRRREVDPPEDGAAPPEAGEGTDVDPGRAPQQRGGAPVPEPDRSALREPVPPEAGPRQQPRDPGRRMPSWDTPPREAPVRDAPAREPSVWDQPAGEPGTAPDASRQQGPRQQAPQAASREQLPQRKRGATREAQGPPRVIPAQDLFSDQPGVRRDDGSRDVSLWDSPNPEPPGPAAAPEPPVRRELPVREPGRMFTPEPPARSAPPPRVPAPPQVGPPVPVAPPGAAPNGVPVAPGAPVPVAGPPPLPGRPPNMPVERPTDQMPRIREPRAGALDPGLTGPIQQQRPGSGPLPELEDRVPDDLVPSGLDGPDREGVDAGPATAVGVAPVGAEAWHRARTSGVADDDGGPPTQASRPLDFDDFDDHPAGLGGAGIDEERDEAPAGAAAEPRRRVGRPATETTAGSWAPVLAQWIIGAIGGAALWVGFRYLWGELLVVAVAASVLVTVGLVVVVRALLRNSDMRTTVFAVLVGLLLTVSPAILVLMGR